MPISVILRLIANFLLRDDFLHLETVNHAYALGCRVSNHRFCGFI